MSSSTGADVPCCDVHKSQVADNFNPPPEAEPGSTASNNQPTVLSKLQKWGDYESMGDPVGPTKFVPMKTPMSGEIISNWTIGDGPKHSLTVAELLSTQAARGRRVGLIIDLANHECLYYDDIPEAVEYAHVQLVAKVLPPPEAINEVARIADDFWRRKPDQFVAIHCAYGFNRTGFVVCSYLIQCRGLSVEQAMDCFAEARPPGVKHEKFISELYARYGHSDSDDEDRSSCSAETGGGGGGGSAADGAQEVGKGVRDGQRSSCTAAGGEGDHRSKADEGGRRQPGDREGSSLCVGAEEGAGQLAGSRRGSRRISIHHPTAGSLSVAGYAGSQTYRRVSSRRGSRGEAGDGPELEEDLPAGLDWQAEAERLQLQIPMGRTASLGLAKALCEDFSMFESTPATPSPLRALLPGEAAFAHASLSMSPLDSPISPPWDDAHVLDELGVGGSTGGKGQGCAGGAAAGEGEGGRPEAGAAAGGGGGDGSGRGGAGEAARQGQPERGQPSAAAAGRSTAVPSGPAGAGGSWEGRQAGRPSGGARRPGSGSGAVGGLSPAPSALPPPPPHHATPSGSSRVLLTPAGSLAGVDSGDFTGPRRGYSRFVRSMSVDSDNPSLGFGARQALMHLRGEDPPTVGGAQTPQPPLALLDLFTADGRRSIDPQELDISERTEYSNSEHSSSMLGGSAHSRQRSEASLARGASPQPTPPSPAPSQQAQQPEKQPRKAQRGDARVRGRGKAGCSLM